MGQFEKDMILFRLAFLKETTLRDTYWIYCISIGSGENKVELWHVETGTEKWISSAECLVIDASMTPQPRFTSKGPSVGVIDKTT